MIQSFKEFVNFNKLKEEIEDEDEVVETDEQSFSETELEEISNDHIIREFRLVEEDSYIHSGVKYSKDNREQVVTFCDNRLIDYIYEIFKASYIRKTGSSWTKSKFLSRIFDWTFYGSVNGFLAIRKQRSGLLKLVAAASKNRRSNIDIKNGLDVLCLDKDAKIWGVITDDLAEQLTKMRKDFIKVPTLITKTLIPIIDKSVFGGTVPTVDKDGLKITMTDEFGKETTIVKVLVCNKAYLRSLLDNDFIMSKLPNAVKTLIKVTSRFFIGESVNVDYKIIKDFYFIDESDESDD
jgi:hypothetical protein